LKTTQGLDQVLKKYTDYILSNIFCWKDYSFLLFLTLAHMWSKIIGYMYVGLFLDSLFFPIDLHSEYSITLWFKKIFFFYSYVHTMFGSFLPPLYDFLFSNDVKNPWVLEIFVYLFPIVFPASSTNSWMQETFNRHQLNKSVSNGHPSTWSLLVTVIT
jgi:hypothetical protein